MLFIDNIPMAININCLLVYTDFICFKILWIHICGENIKAIFKIAKSKYILITTLLRSFNIRQFHNYIVINQ